MELVGHLRICVVWRQNLEDDGNRNVLLFKLLVRPAVSPGPAECHQNVRSVPNLGLALHGIPQQIGGDEHVRHLAEQGHRLPYRMKIQRACFVLSDMGFPSQSG